MSQITSGYSTDDKGRPFRRRRRGPVIALVAVLAVVGVVAWLIALVGGGEDARPTTCNQPTAAADTGAPPAPTLAPVPRDEILATAPAALSSFQVRVLNASGQRGAARSVSDDLTAQGFNPAPDAPYADDTVYADSNLDCVAQIRFGPAGRAGAASAWLAMPCAELVDDGRQGTVVDIALGVYFDPKEQQSQDAQAALEALQSADPRNPETGADPELVKAVHNQGC